MAHYLRAVEVEGDIAESVKEHRRDREKWIEAETSSAVHIQTRFRSSKAYHQRKIQSYMAKEIQRFLRGHFGRKRSRKARAAKNTSMERLLFDYYAEIVQKTWRGYRSRRFTHDFWARKKYIKTVEQRGNELRQELDAYAAKRLATVKLERAKSRKKELATVTQNLHHLLSTESIPGVYNNPYFQNNRPRIDGELVEDVLRRAFTSRIAIDRR